MPPEWARSGAEGSAGGSGAEGSRAEGDAVPRPREPGDAAPDGPGSVAPSEPAPAPASAAPEPAGGGDDRDSWPWFAGRPGAEGASEPAATPVTRAANDPPTTILPAIDPRTAPPAPPAPAVEVRSAAPTRQDGGRRPGRVDTGTPGNGDAGSGAGDVRGPGGDLGPGRDVAGSPGESAAGKPPPLPKRVPQTPPPPFGIAVSPGGSSLFEPTGSRPGRDVNSSTGRWNLRSRVESRPIDPRPSRAIEHPPETTPADAWGLTAASEQSAAGPPADVPPAGRPADPSPGAGSPSGGPPGGASPGGGWPAVGSPGGGPPADGRPGSGLSGVGSSGGGPSDGGSAGGGLQGHGLPDGGLPGSGSPAGGPPSGGLARDGLPSSGSPGGGFPGAGSTGGGSRAGDGGSLWSPAGEGAAGAERSAGDQPLLPLRRRGVPPLPTPPVTPQPPPAGSAGAVVEPPAPLRSGPPAGLPRAGAPAGSSGGPAGDVAGPTSHGRPADGPTAGAGSPGRAEAARSERAADWDQVIASVEAGGIGRERRPYQEDPTEVLGPFDIGRWTEDAGKRSDRGRARPPAPSQPSVGRADAGRHNGPPGAGPQGATRAAGAGPQGAGRSGADQQGGARQPGGGQHGGGRHGGGRPGAAQHGAGQTGAGQLGDGQQDGGRRPGRGDRVVASRPSTADGPARPGAGRGERPTGAGGPGRDRSRPQGAAQGAPGSRDKPPQGDARLAAVVAAAGGGNHTGPEEPTRGDRVRTAIRGVAQLFITLGLVLLLFAVYEVWFTGVLADRAQGQLKTELDQRWETGDDPVIAAQQPAKPGTTVRTIPLGEGFALIYVPDFGPDYVFTIIEGIGTAQLDKGPGHYPDSVLPGQVGNFAVAGHRVGKGSPFLNLDKLKVGSAIVIRTKTYWYTYRVLGDPASRNPRAVGALGIPGMQVVDPRETGVIAPVPDRAGVKPTQRLLTLTTCHPKFSARERLVIHAQLEGAPRPASQGLPPALGSGGG